MDVALQWFRSSIIWLTPEAFIWRSQAQKALRADILVIEQELRAQRQLTNGLEADVRALDVRARAALKRTVSRR